MDAVADLRVRLVDVPELAQFDPQSTSFCNINLPEEYFRLREKEHESEVEIPSFAAIAATR